MSFSPAEYKARPILVRLFPLFFFSYQTYSEELSNLVDHRRTRKRKYIAVTSNTAINTHTHTRDGSSTQVNLLSIYSKRMLIDQSFSFSFWYFSFFFLVFVFSVVTNSYLIVSSSSSFSVTREKITVCSIKE